MADLLPSVSAEELVVNTTEWLVFKPLRILLIIVIALVVRWLAHRAIRRLTTPGSKDSDKVPLLLRPLRERAPAVLAETGLLSERRRQRANTIGSVLRNVTSIAIFTVAALTILAEFEVDLGPILASAGIAGVALGFGAQYLVRDVISGMFMIIEDQYGVGDVVDLGEATGTVEEVGLRVTKVRDVRGVVWYVRNGEVLRVGNMSQGWARAVIDVPIGFGTPVEEAVTAIRDAAARIVEDPEIADKVTEAPEVWGVENVTIDGPVVRIVVKTVPGEQWAVGRHLRRGIVDALNEAGISSRLTGSRVYVRPGSDAAQQPQA